jgi:hypothetical protein
MRRMITTKLTRKQIAEGLEQVPFRDIMGKQAAQALTPKMQAFALEVAKGSSGAEAVRKVYKSKGKKQTQANDAYKLKRRPEVAASIEAFERAIELQKYYTSAGLRALVIESLVKVITDENSNASQITNAAKVLGTVTEVAAFTERKEVTTITSSEDARARVMMQLRDMMKSNATDAVEIEADSLLKELAGEDTTPTTPIGQLESLTTIHSVSHESSEVLPISEPTPINTLVHTSNDDPTESTPL